MAKTYNEVINSLNEAHNAYLNLVNANGNVSQIVCAQGRYMRKLNSTIRWCDKNGYSSAPYRNNLGVEFDLRNQYLKRENRQNRKGNYNMIVRMGKGCKNIVDTISNGVEQTIKGADSNQKIEGAKQIGIGALRGVGHIAKSSLSIVTRLISTRAFVGLLMFPAHFLGIFVHAGAHVHDKPIPKYEGRRIKKAGDKILQGLTKLHNTVERL